MKLKKKKKRFQLSIHGSLEMCCWYVLLYIQVYCPIFDIKVNGSVVKKLIPYVFNSSITPSPTEPSSLHTQFLKERKT